MTIPDTTCPDCGYTCANLVAEPVRQVYDMRTGEISVMNVLTGEVFDEVPG